MRYFYLKFNLLKYNIKFTFFREYIIICRFVIDIFLSYNIKIIYCTFSFNFNFVKYSIYCFCHDDLTL